MAGPYRDSAVITATGSTPTVVHTYPGVRHGKITSIYVHSLNGGAETVSAYLLPRDVTTVSDEYLISPKAFDLPNKDGLDFELVQPIWLFKGDQVAFTSGTGSLVMAVVCSEEVL